MEWNCGASAAWMTYTTKPYDAQLVRKVHISNAAQIRKPTILKIAAYKTFWHEAC